MIFFKHNILIGIRFGALHACRKIPAHDQRNKLVQIIEIRNIVNGVIVCFLFVCLLLSYSRDGNIVLNSFTIK